MLKKVSVCTLMLLSCSAAAQSAPPASIAHSADERAVLKADARQRDAVASADLKALAAISHRNLRINAAINRVLTRDDLVRMVGSGEIRNEVFERIPESVVVTGNVGVVMGHEVVFPGAVSEQARIYGRKTLNRRYTNVFIRKGGTWLHLARQASVIGEVTK